MKVTISGRAEQNLEKIASYLEKEWSNRVRNKFLALLTRKIGQIARTPLMYEASSKKKGIRRCVVTRQTILYYRVKKEEIEIITIQDTRQSPKSLRL